jgi:hypothetical protein
MVVNHARCAIDGHVRPQPPSFREAMVIASCTWSTPSVNALLAGLIGIAATLLGSFTTYLFQSRTAERAQAFERDERLRYEQVKACSAYATAMTELKRGLITLWFYQRRDAAGADYLATRIECDRLGASAEAARFRVQLVLGDPAVMMLADAVGGIRWGSVLSPGCSQRRRAETRVRAPGNLARAHAVGACASRSSANYGWRPACPSGPVRRGRDAPVRSG